MLQVSYITENKEATLAGLRKKNFKEVALVDELVEMDSARRQLQHKLNTIQADANRISKEVGKLFSEGKKQEADVLKQQSADLKEQTKTMQ